MNLQDQVHIFGERHDPRQTGLEIFDENLKTLRALVVCYLIVRVRHIAQRASVTFDEKEPVVSPAGHHT